MLMPDERSEAIRVLARSYQSIYMQYNANPNPTIELLIHGHKGFANFTDIELLRALQTFAKKNNAYEAQQFITSFAMEKFTLE